VVEYFGSDNGYAAKRGKNADEFSYLQNRASQEYSGLRINEYNNDDMTELFRKRWQAKTVRSQSISCYAQFRACVCQFARFCVTLKLVEAEEICSRGTLLRLVSESSVVKGLFGFWQSRAVAYAVYSKVNLLKIIVCNAWEYYGVKSEEVYKIEARDVNEYIMSVATGNKNETRSSSSARRHVDVRANREDLFYPLITKGAA
jgi:hypothetical protein